MRVFRKTLHFLFENIYSKMQRNQRIVNNFATFSENYRVVRVYSVLHLHIYTLQLLFFFLYCNERR